MENQNQIKTVRIASAIFQLIAMLGLITGIVTNTAFPIIAGVAASLSACVWQMAVSKWGE